MKNANQSDENAIQQTRSSISTTILAATAGAIAGGAAALLLAPHTGSETRKTLKAKAGQLKDNLNETIKQGMERMNHKAVETKGDLS